MANNQGQAGQQEAWQNNREMNIQENTSVSNDVQGDNESTESGQSSWRPTEEGWRGAGAEESSAGQSPAQSSEVNVQSSQTGSKSGDPGRTPGKAEGEEDFERTGNE